VAHNHHVNAHRLQVAARIDQAFTLGGAAGFLDDVHQVSAQALCGQAEAGLGARAGFKEQVENDLAAQGGGLLDAAGRDLGKAAGGIQQVQDLALRQFLKPQQVLADPAWVNIKLLF
jgi:hypothetical protein